MLNHFYTFNSKLIAAVCFYFSSNASLKADRIAYIWKRGGWSPQNKFHNFSVYLRDRPLMHIAIRAILPICHQNSGVFPTSANISLCVFAIYAISAELA